LVIATHGRGIWIIDDISPLRSLTPEVMASDAGFLPVPTAIQWMETNGGWPEGANSYNGPERSPEASIPYYQRTRHIFGDLKIEIFDAQGKLVDTVASSKHRGVNRATWSMHLRAPKVPPAASALFGAAVGPRIVPGTYTVKMTKGDKVYNTQLKVALDPRATYSVEDRTAQFDLAMRLGQMLNHMSWAVDDVIGVRDQANTLATKASGPLQAQLQKLAEGADKIRTKIVATKEGGAITGEERLREYLGTLYGDVNGYEGRPTDSQVARADVMQRQLEDVIKEFATLTSQQLPAINRQLQSKKLGEIKTISEKDWQATHSDDADAAASQPKQMREMD